MLSFISGVVVEKTPTYVVLEANALGYQVFVSLNTGNQLTVGEQIKLHTHFHIREDVQALYGFLDQKERSVFRILISVSGISVNSAMMILSTLSPSELVQAVLNNDEHRIVSIKGIGLKTAKKLILEAKDKLVKEKELNCEQEDNSTTSILKQQALTALENLGIARKIAERKCEDVLKANTEIQLEDLIRQVLKNLQV